MTNTPQLIGVSRGICAVREDIECAARTDAKVLVTGESGVGKEIVSQLIHHRSARRQAPLVTMNCAGVPDTLLASELFGHLRGSFTDAYRDKQGWLEQAHRGTVFLDEIGEMSVAMQSLLLRFLENGEIQPVGSDRRSTHVDVRVIAATNRRLVERVTSGEFRADLFYRLNVIHIEVPPLRERREDVPVLLQHFLAQFSTRHRVEMPRLSDEAAAQMIAAPWPGNVRQLRNVAERLTLRAHDGIVSVVDLPREVLSMGAPGMVTGTARSAADVLFEKMVRDGETFWSAVYEPFMSHDITRGELRALVRQALAVSAGGYRDVARLFNVADDHRRLLQFLRKHECHLPDRELTAAPAHRSPERTRTAIGG
jgi:DNA-binding NtrC family response regulator